MYDHGDKASKPKTGATAQAERRGTNRHPFIAAAEVTELASGSIFSTRTQDLGPGGCFVDTLVPFDTGSRVRIKIREGAAQFETTGIVVYSQSGLGMGIAFDELDAQQRKALAAWLGQEITQIEQKTQVSPSPKPMLPHGSDREALVRLVKLMVKKGMLSEAEATSVFGNPTLL